MPSDTENQIRQGKVDDIYRSRVTSGAKDPRLMVQAEIVAEINNLQETLNLAAQRMIHLSQNLHTHARRSATTDSAASAYVAYASAWGRFAGAIQQGVRRTLLANKLLDRALGSQKEDREASDRLAARQKQIEERKRSKPEARSSPLRNASPLRTLEGDSIDDLMQLYGSEIVRGARR